MMDVGAVLGRIWSGIRGFGTKAGEKAAELWETRRRVLIFGFGAFLALLFLGLLAVALLRTLGGRRQAPPSAALSEAFKVQAIPPEEIFLPEEPDFLPAVILGRERRDSWTAEDARPFWVDPAGMDRWEDRIKTVIDRYLERVP
jgi:hypothetical protein